MPGSRSSSGSSLVGSERLGPRRYSSCAHGVRIGVGLVEETEGFNGGGSRRGG